MITFRKYFAYHAKSSLLRLAALAALVIVASVFKLSVDGGVGLLPIAYQLSLNTWNTYPIFFLCMLIAALELAPFKSKRNVDSLFSLPLTRRGLAAAHYLNGLLQIFILLVINMLVSFVRFLQHADQIDLWLLLLHLPIAFVVCALFYSINTFAFDRANSVFDGVMFEIAYFFACWPLCWLIGRLTEDVAVLWHGYENYTPYYVIDRLDAIFIYFMSRRNHLWHSIPFAVSFKITLVFLLWGLFAAFGYFFLSRRVRPEKIGGISDSIFGYRAILPLFGVSLMALWSESGAIALAVLPVMLLFYIIFRRSARLQLSDVISLAVSAALGVAFILLFPR